MAKKHELRFPAPTPEKNLWFISDTHWYHSAILRPDYSGRPFKDVEDMNETMVANWNAAVGANDVVFHLGDLAMAGPKLTAAVVRRLAGRKFLVYGNHDQKIRGVPDVESLFEKVFDFGCQIKVEDADALQGFRHIVLCHYALRTWSKSHYGAWSLYGHSHGNLAEPETLLSMDVGVDATARRAVDPRSKLWTWGRRQVLASTRDAYRPISYAEVKATLSQRVLKPIDRPSREEGADE